MEDEGRTTEKKLCAGHSGVFLLWFCSKDQNCSSVLWDLERCTRLVSHPHEVRMEIHVLDVVAMMVRREKNRRGSPGCKKLGNSRKETFWSLPP